MAKAALSAPEDLKTMIRELQRVSETFNRRLSFSLNEKLGQVVVKIIDNDTDKVVREIPPVELQRCDERIREVLGLLFDKSA
jgi:flagellar protein FlaG